jgi:predicted DNA-binding transcriptional regulator AlpA
MRTVLLRFADLRERGIVMNWPTLQRWIREEGFPPGRLLGKNTRAWTEQEIADWIESRPAERHPEREAA